MTHLTGNERAQYVQNMFGRIAQRYDLMNRIMTGGQDIAWRRESIGLAKLAPGARLLDLGAGTGDLAREALKQQPAAFAVAADFTVKMMLAGQKYGPLNWSAADALCVPFPDETFDVVVSGYLMRNVSNLPLALSEQRRVLKPGGRIIILDTTRPKRNLLSPFIWLHMHVIIPILGNIIAGASDAYTYLPDSTENFLNAEDLAARMKDAGFKNISFRRKMFGTMAIHYGEK